MTISLFSVGDIVKIVPNHKPFSRGLTTKYPEDLNKMLLRIKEQEDLT